MSRNVLSVSVYFIVSQIIMKSGPYHILAITEGRGKARGEVGIAAIDVYRPNLIVSQISDCQMYSKSLAKISILSPVEVDFLINEDYLI